MQNIQNEKKFNCTHCSKTFMQKTNDQRKEADLVLKESEQIFVCPNIYPEQLEKTEINMDYCNPLSDEELRNVDVLSID